MPLHIAKSFKELIFEAKEAEENNELEKAAKLYERTMKLEPHDESSYNRLMIIYRKLGKYEDELRVIDKGVSVFEEFYKKKSEKIISKNKAAEKLSKSLAKSLGLTDKKGKDIYHQEPIEKWLKRRQVVEKKIRK
jgi:tetratricopeptide (TPR) repeat protein